MRCELAAGDAPCRRTAAMRTGALLLVTAASSIWLLQGCWLFEKGDPYACNEGTLADHCEAVRRDLQMEADPEPYLLGEEAVCDLWEADRIEAADFCEFCQRGVFERNDLINLDEFCVLEPSDEIRVPYSQMLTRLREMAEDENCRDGRAWIETGVCKDSAMSFIRSGDGFVVELYLYDPGSEAFLGFTSSQDAIFLPCCGRFFWPTLLSCDSSEPSEVLCPLGG